MMHTIRISEAVWKAIADRGKFGETEDDVLRRVLCLPSKDDDEQESEVTDGRRGRGNRRFAKKGMSARVEGEYFSVKFDDGVSRRWGLPHRSDKDAIKLLLDKPIAFAKATVATDPGQPNAVRKSL